VRLIDAGFIWTEPHSKRVKVKLTVQKEVAPGAILQQTFVVEFTIFNQICDDCQRIEAKDYWKALVQVRQRVRSLADWALSKGRDTCRRFALTFI
jgi:nonsense-mediated mRNA decay protein 3